MSSYPDFELLAWDSEFFGFPVARMRDALEPQRLPETLRQLRARGARVAYWMPERTPMAERAAQVSGATLAGARVTFVHELAPATSAAAPARVEPYRGAVQDPELMRLGVIAGRLSRFAVDPRFPSGSAERMYRIWIERSVRGEIADAVLVARADSGALTGLVTLAADGQTGEIGLLAVDEEARGAGVGRALVEAALARFRSVGRRRAQVATQADNAAACRLYEACGFDRAREQTVFHFWL